MVFSPPPIKFGTDGWRGVLGADFTFERVALVAGIAAQVLRATFAGPGRKDRIIVGYDRRFMAEDFAQLVAETVAEQGFEVWLSQSYAPTPAFSWAAHQEQALGALVLTASHNPARYLGLKVKGAFGGSVGPEITSQIEAQLSQGLKPAPQAGEILTFDSWPSYCQALQAKVDITAIRRVVEQGQLQIFVDVMHGAAAGGLARLLGCEVRELNSERDPLFGGASPEPLARYVPELLQTIQTAAQQDQERLRVGLVFDGDADRIAAVDGQGQFLSSQGLIPILIDHLARHRGLGGEIVKTISGSDLIPRLAQLYDRPLQETAIGYKYIADRMLGHEVLIGGEESGGIGYGSHIPERDALLSALYVLEAVVESQRDISQLYQDLQAKTHFYAEYDRIDLPLASMAVRGQLLDYLAQTPFPQIAGSPVTDCLNIDGYKFRLQSGGWLLIRFSGTEPVLRLYCEAPTLERVQAVLQWAKDWALSFA
ncbi:phosphoglucomutase/phosphomannomutase family protein [Synechocystis sp. LKSZ1]|uniref:phosphoglucomutase/phosphomannomutase family protein n=1 Tax=Synechocystis sp. LKSZ1 TaxID=3144951 RepID=UPI00336BB1D5